MLLQRLLQPLSPARDDQVDHAVLGRELAQLVAVAAAHDRDRALGHARPLHRARRHLRQHGVRVRRGRRAAQHDRVARLEAQRRAVDRHVRARLVDDRHHAERHAHAPHVEPVLEPVPIDRLAHRVGERRDRAHVRRDAGQPLLGRASAGRAGPSASPASSPASMSRAFASRISCERAARSRRPSPRARRSWSRCRALRARARRPSPARRPRLPTGRWWPCRQGIGRRSGQSSSREVRRQRAHRLGFGSASRRCRAAPRSSRPGRPRRPRSRDRARATAARSERTRPSEAASIPHMRKRVSPAPMRIPSSANTARSPAASARTAARSPGPVHHVLVVGERMRAARRSARASRAPKSGARRHGPLDHPARRRVGALGVAGAERPADDHLPRDRDRVEHERQEDEQLEGDLVRAERVRRRRAPARRSPPGTTRRARPCARRSRRRCAPAGASRERRPPRVGRRRSSARTKAAPMPGLRDHRRPGRAGQAPVEPVDEDARSARR